MTISEFIFLGALGSAYVVFMVVLAWTSHQTTKYLQDRDREADSTSPASPPRSANVPQNYDRAA